MKNRKSVIVIVSIIIIGSLVIFLYPKKLGTIDHKEVNLDELITYAEKNENRVSNEFTTKHNISSYGKEFWLQEFDGEYPIDELYEASLNDLIRHRSILKLALSLNIIDDTTFNDEKVEWEHSRNGLSLWQFLDAKDERLTNEIKKELLEVSPPSDEQLKEAFENLDDKYKQMDFAVDFIVIEGFSGGEGELHEIAKSIPKSLSLDDSVIYWQEQLPENIISSMHLDTQEIHKENLYMMSISEILLDKDVADIAEGYEEGQYFFVVDKKGGGLLTLEEAPRFGEVAYINALFEQRLQETLEILDVELTAHAEKGFKNYYRKK